MPKQIEELATTSQNDDIKSSSYSKTIRTVHLLPVTSSSKQYHASNGGCVISKTEKYLTLFLNPFHLHFFFLFISNKTSKTRCGLCCGR
jgi:hypothetical protein